jgi:hypothetical protein
MGLGDDTLQISLLISSQPRRLWDNLFMYHKSKIVQRIDRSFAFSRQFDRDLSGWKKLSWLLAVIPRDSGPILSSWGVRLMYASLKVEIFMILIAAALFNSRLSMSGSVVEPRARREGTLLRFRIGQRI